VIGRRARAARSSSGRDPAPRTPTSGSIAPAEVTTRTPSGARRQVRWTGAISLARKLEHDAGVARHVRHKQCRQIGMIAGDAQHDACFGLASRP